MPNVPQLLPASSSQKREISEKDGFLQSCAAGAVMVIVTGVKADGGDVVAWLRSGMASADAGGVLA